MDGIWTFGILTVSDRCAAGTTIDQSGPLLESLIRSTLNANKIFYEIVCDDQTEIQNRLKYLCDTANCHAVFTTGGTGFAARDVTPEATKNVITKEAPQLANMMFLESLKKTKFAVLSRAICGIRNRTLIINFPGSKKAVQECFDAISSVISHAVQLMINDLEQVSVTHKEVQRVEHACPHKTGSGKGDDRNSPYPMIKVAHAINEIFAHVKPLQVNTISNTSPINIPPFRASIKDGYAIKSAGGAGLKKVIGFIAAGDNIISTDFEPDECYKINTGAAVPDFADVVIQVEDTKLIKTENNIEKEIEIVSKNISSGLDIRAIGSDLSIGEVLFDNSSKIGIPEKSVLASVGIVPSAEPKIKIAIVSTGAELIAPSEKLTPGKIYDSNTTMLTLLLEQFGFSAYQTRIVDDKYDSLKQTIDELTNSCDVIISSGGVSVGDFDFVKQIVVELGYDLIFGRVNMKPGKPMTFGYKSNGNKSYFGLPGNPVSAFVTFHLFVLPCLRYLSGWSIPKCILPSVNVVLLNDIIYLDSRPEYCRARIISKNGALWAEITGNQISSRLMSTIGADALIQLPEKSESRESVKYGDTLKASLIKLDFISRYDD